MMIELEHRDGTDVPIPYNVDTNDVNTHLMDYFIYRKKYAKFIHHTLRNVSPKTINNDAQRIKYLINLLSQQKYVDQKITKVGIHYCSARYETNMVPIIDGLRTAEWEEESIEQYVKSWRNFYRYLTVAGIDHLMYMPDTVQVSMRKDQDDNFLSHTSYDNNYAGEKETAIESRNKKFKDDYVDSVISMADFWRLYANLHAQDEVYAVMAYCEFATLLRVEALVRDFPLIPNSLNPNFKPYALMERQDTRIQDLNYIAKGGRKKTTQFSVSVHKIFNDEYIKSDICNYEQRFKKYQDNYCKTKWAKKKHRTPQMRFCWLNRQGTPVSVREYQGAFEKAADELGITVHTHMMRHSGATQLLWRYLKEHNLTASHTNDLLVTDAHAVLQKMLGHMDIKTTKMYVKTVERMIQSEKLSMLLNVALSTSRKHHEDLVKNNKVLSDGLSSMERAIKRFEEYMTGSNILSKIERKMG
ncbi:site-specific integrase [uncultured Paraglaciecola sp.]|uniref:site-specific integrase n=1 Tax=uncultured Paraglaciecola sp. TaxID=1765024 RepID=UPI0030D91B73|tara:strand:- start:522 stop:1934 length:1413 start_codon:yes stop_codon:yes gene_type:complete